MPKISDLIAEKAAKGEDWVSYEYFPPRSEQGVKNLLARFERMKAARAPLFCDMTYLRCADTPRTGRGDAAAATRGHSEETARSRPARASGGAPAARRPSSPWTSRSR